MATLVLDLPEETSFESEPEPAKKTIGSVGWIVFQYAPVSLFSLKSSRATSTAGKTLLTPTPYAIKMAFLDVALRHELTDDPQGLVEWLAKAELRIGVPEHACVTGTIQRVRQETRDAERKEDPDLAPYRATIAMREFVYYHGVLRFAFDLTTCSEKLVALLLQAAPSINYLGKRGSFLQYLNSAYQADLDATFTRPSDDPEGRLPPSGHRAVLDDFGTKPSFAALNSFSSTEMRRGIDRKFVETIIPLDVYNSGPGFVHYSASASTIT